MPDDEYYTKAMVSSVYSEDSNDIVAYDDVIHIIRDGEFGSIFVTSPGI